MVCALESNMVGVQMPTYVPVVHLLGVAGSHEAEENGHVNKLSNILKALTASEVHLEESVQCYSFKDQHQDSKEHDGLISHNNHWLIQTLTRNSQAYY